MKPHEKHQLQALNTFVDCAYMQKNIDILSELQRYLSCQVVEGNLDTETYDDYTWLLYRLEDLLKEIKLATDVQQVFNDRNN